VTRLVLDAEAFNALAGPSSARRTEIRRVLLAVEDAGGEVIVPTVVLAELYRPGHLAMVDACLSRRDGAPATRDTDRGLARLVGGVLAAAGAGSDHLADAHVVAAAVEGGPSIVITGDGDDLTRLAAPFASVTVVGLP
jgi:predicted nucleic acid-binding protein